MAKSMTRQQFGAFMKRCKTDFNVRYVEPTIHPRANLITAVKIHTADESVAFTITNNPDLDFELNAAVNGYLDKLEGGR
jgi:hypothetical protein